MNSDASAQANEIRSPIIASWVLLIVTCLLALIPVVGFLTWFIGGVTITIALILGVVVISKGGTWHGIFILLASLLFVPCVIIVAPIVTTLIAGVVLDEKSSSGDSAPLIEITTETATSTAEDAQGKIAEPDTEGAASDYQSGQSVKESAPAAPVPGNSSDDPPNQ